MWSVGPQSGPVTVPILKSPDHPVGLRKALRASVKVYTGYSSKAVGSLSLEWVGVDGWRRNHSPEASHAAEQGSDGLVSTVI